MPELDRRNFLKMVGMSVAGAATAACQEPVEAIVPYLNHPEEIIPGIPTYYASVCRECPVGCGATVTTREGRPIKVDGLIADPRGQGTLCVRGQASLYRTYDAARFRSPMKRDADGQLVPATWDEALAILAEKLASEGAAGRVAFVTGLETGTLDRLIDQFLAAVGSPQRLSFELFAHEALRSANARLFGVDAVPQFELGRADLIVSFGADFLETWLDPVKNQLGYAISRRAGKGFAAYVGPRLSMTAANTDLWLAADPGSEILIALALAGEVAKRRGVDLGAFAAVTAEHGLADAARRSGVAFEKLESLAERMARAQAPLALPPGNELQGTNATAFAAAVQLLNFASGAIGKTVLFGPNHNLGGLARFADVKQLVEKLRADEIGVLLVHGANPVYHASQLGLAEAMGSPKLFTVSFGSAADETTALADLVLPDHTPFESWGDVEPVAGLRCAQQPTINPLFDTRATGDVLLELGRKLGGANLPAGTFKDAVVASFGAAGFDAVLASGGQFLPAAETPVTLSGSAQGLDFDVAAVTGKGDLKLLLYPSLALYDGRSARIALLQEMPDPVTKLVWGSYAELHPETAARLGVADADVVRVTTGAGEVSAPVFTHEALRKDVVALSVGQGHRPVDPGAPFPDHQQRRNVIGVNALTLLPGRFDPVSGGLAWLSTRASVSPTGEVRLLPKTQATFHNEGRGFAQSIALAALGAPSGAGDEEAHSAGDPEDHHDAKPYGDALHLETLDFDPVIDARDANYRWAMVIDTDLCSGCNACVAACAVENCIPTIGEMLVRQGREMHWMRIERWVEQRDGQLEVANSPMLCQHCGAAPCENVCPVYATYHNPEGLNAMVPNRCIGTRYCANNCPYKARRFNYFAYDWSIREPEHLVLNPDVTVRSKGVMEKCSFCVQRISAAKDRARLEDRTVADGEVIPACAQACPSRAIVFGNHKDPESLVARARDDGRAYWILHHLNTRPAVTYLKSIRRGETRDA